MPIYPLALWHPISGPSGRYLGGPFKIVHHTTEGSSAQGAFSAFAAHRSDPHFTVDETAVHQHIDTDMAARALRNDEGGVQTNRDSAVQIEVVGFAHRPKSKAVLRNVALLCRWIEATHGVPRVWPNGLPKPAKNGKDPGGHNRDAATWDTKGGHYGHCHVPENSHWDPAYTAAEVDFLMSFSGQEGLVGGRSFDEIPETDPGLATDSSHMPDHSHADGAAAPTGAEAAASRDRLARWGKEGLDAAEKAIREGRIAPETFGFAPRSGFESTGPDVEAWANENPLGLEAIILKAGRPPLLIRNDRIVWEKIDLLPDFTEKAAQGAERFVPSVGRVEFVNHDMAWGGTGFVVEEAPNGRRRVVTNRHVASIVARRAADGSGIFLRSPLGPRYGARLDMREEANAARSDAFELPVTRIEYIADDTEADMAILEIAVREGLAPAPIPLADKRAKDGELVATIGYPARDSRNDRAVMEKYFGDLYDVKRFAPGRIKTGGAGTILSHDCTTLGGNSGSCLLSLEQKAVVGLHYSGQYGVANAAVSAETVKRILKGARVTVPGAVLEAAEGLADGEHDAADLKGREGYDPAFLGGGLTVPWPDLAPALRADLAKPSDARARDDYELRYTHFGVLYSRARRSPRVTAVNIDGQHAVRIKRERDRWFYDLRIDRDIQLGSGAYKNPELDRGHMVRREDPNWGKLAERANFDTFHYTNSALQHSGLNRARTMWLGLENYILNSSRTHGFRASVFTGPVCRDDDMPMPPSNAPIPREFWKVIAMPTPEGGLHATAYLLSQGDLIRDLKEARNLDEAAEGFVLSDFRTFQIAIAHIEDLTGLSFPALRQADPLAKVRGGNEAIDQGAIAYLPVESLEDIVL